MTVNIEKTKVLVFGRGKQPKNETFTYKDKPLATTNEYKYLGIVLSRSGSFKNAIKHITEQANKAMFSLLKKIRILNLPIELKIDLFNKMVKPVLLYGCKLWGIGNTEPLERIQLKFLKYIFHLKTSTPSFMVYGETSCMPLSFDINCRLISFWTQLPDTENNCNRLSTLIYSVLYILYRNGKCKSLWLDKIINLINTNGFGGIWSPQTNFNRKWFTVAFKQKLKDQFLQNWNTSVDQASSGTNYRLNKYSFEKNNYITYLTNSQIRTITKIQDQKSQTSNRSWSLAKQTPK